MSNRQQFLLVSTATIEKISERLDFNFSTDLLIKFFRPNILISGLKKPNLEYEWKRIRIGAVEFKVVESCVRCKTATINPESGEFHAEILEVLKENEKPPILGIYLQQIKFFENSILSVGDDVEILE